MAIYTDDVIYEFPVEFREQIIALVLQPGWLARFRGVVRPEYFPTDFEQEFVRSIFVHREQYNMLPTLADLLNEYDTRYASKPLHSDLEYDDYKDFVVRVCELSKNRLLKTQDEVVEWARNNAMRIALIQSVDYQLKGDYPAIRGIVAEALQVGNDLTQTGLELVGDATSWVSSFVEQPLQSTPWMHVNKYVGGLGPGELGGILAPSGGYKSTALVNLGYHAAGIVHQRNVFHASAEMSEVKTLMRYAARTTFKFYEPSQDSKQYVQELISEARKKLRGRIRVKQFVPNKHTIADIGDMIKDLQDGGFSPDMVIIDYPAKLRPARARKERRFELNQLHEDSKALAIEVGVPVWIGIQGNRGAFNKKIIRQEDIGEDISIAQVCDIIMSACQTSDEKKLNQMRLFGAKVREAKGGWQVRLKVHFPALISVGDVQYNTDDEESFDD